MPIDSIDECCLRLSAAKIQKKNDICKFFVQKVSKMFPK